MERKDFLRNTLGFLGISVIAVKCNKSDVTTPATTDSTGTTTGSTSLDSCTVTNTETAGPYPTHTPSGLSRANIVDGQEGIPLAINITIKDTNNSCAALSGAVVDIWHCNALGYYSEYNVSAGAGYAAVDNTSSHFLRGRLVTDANGLAAFTSIFTGWYSGRAPHIHVHVYDSSGKSLLVTQIAFPADVCNTVYTTALPYSAKGKQDTSNSADMVFSDSLSDELATVTGSVANGYTLTHVIKVAA